MSLPQFQKKKRVQNISYEYQAKNLKEEATYQKKQFEDSKDC
jgi:hypothetical protein